MSDSNNDDVVNPVEQAAADKPTEAVTREDCYWSGKAESVLFDAYVMLRDAGYTRTQLNAFGDLLESTTIYTQDDAERYYKTMLKHN